MPKFTRETGPSILDRAVARGKLSAAAAANIARWLAGPGYDAFQPLLAGMMDGEQFDELERCFWEVIPFGTGGRRGPMAAIGSATINARTISESAAGLAAYLRTIPGTAGGRVAVACDTRNRSREFALLSARVLAAAGFQALLFDGPRATPELSFAVRHLKCAAGLMISASHNPPSDNGVKVYWSHGGQVLPPHDAAILAAVMSVGDIPLADYDEALAADRIVSIGADVDRAYVNAVVGQSISTERALSVLYSPLHGVGESSVARVLRAAGFSSVELYAAHREPDGNFPNVPNGLANPELPSVFEGPLARARETSPDLIMASDPDADRLGAMVRAGSGDYVYLTGNRIAALLLDFVLRGRRRTGGLPAQDYVLTTLVTTPLVARISQACGVRVIEDLLVGFKYIGAAMDRLGPRGFVFGCEESLGYLCGDYARDKDAAVAALLLCELAAELRKSGKTLLDQLDDLHRQHGYVAEAQHSETRRGPEGQAAIRKLMDRLREAPPAVLGGIHLTQTRDFGRHEVRRLPDNLRTAALAEPQSDLVILESLQPDLELRLAARPSGTEPKIKFYLFLRTSVPSSGDLEAHRKRADAQAGQILADFLDWAR